MSIRRLIRASAAMGTALAGFVIASPAAHAGGGGLPCGTIIDTPSTTVTLQGDIDCATGTNGSAFGLAIIADNVVLDMNGYALVGPNTPNSGIWDQGIYVTSIAGPTANNVTVKNGTVTGSPVGVHYEDVHGGTIRDLTVIDNFGPAGGPLSDWGHGIRLSLGGDHLVTGNQILHNGPFAGIGLVFGTSGNTITGNTVLNNNVPHIVSGVQQDRGIAIEDSPDNTVSDNEVAGSGLAGVSVTGATSTGNVISGNSIHDNGTGGPGLGIDLGNDGVTPNDLADPDPGPNLLQNFPVVTSASTSVTGTAVGVDLNSYASTDFTVEFFSTPACNPSGYGEGQTFLGSTPATTDASGNVSFAALLDVGVIPGDKITATATGPNGTSEFSACVAAAPAPDAAEIAVFRPSDGVWYVRGGPTVAWGTNGDIPVAGDYNGDGNDEIAVFRAGTWFIHTGPTVAWGTTGDIPVPADYDGDGDDDIAVFRPSTSAWYVNGGPIGVFGTTGDIPVPDDYDGDGDDDIAVFRPSTATWYVNGGVSATFGTAGDVPVPGDYDGDGDAEFAVYRPFFGTWFVNGGPSVTLGVATDIPVPVDYNSDGATDIAVFRPSAGLWFLDGGTTVSWGTNGDIPVPADYVG